MPISSDKSILFVHIPKVAGKSIGKVFNVYRRDHVPGRGMLNRAATLLQRLTGNLEATDFLTGMVDLSFYGPHMTFREILVLELIPDSLLAQMHKIAVCRNPYDRAVSIFNHLNGASRNYPQSGGGFKAFWKNLPLASSSKLKSNHNFRAICRPQWQYCVDLRGEMAMDYMLRFESLEADVRHVSNELQIDLDSLPWVGKNRDGKDFRQYYDAESKEIIDQIFALDFEMFEYDRELDY